MEYSKGDVRKVAQALIDCGVEWDCSDSNDADGYDCNCCDGGKQYHLYDRNDYKHKTDCPVLVAQDLLTEGKGQ